MPLGETLKQQSKRYRVILDNKYNVWRILDTWHPDITNMDLSDDIDDENPALLILPNDALTEILKEMERLNIQKSTPEQKKENSKPKEFKPRNKFKYNPRFNKNYHDYYWNGQYNPNGGFVPPVNTYQPPVRFPYPQPPPYGVQPPAPTSAGYDDVEKMVRIIVKVLRGLES